MKIAIPQLNYRVGDIQNNKEHILSTLSRAKAEKADLVVFAEHAICGAYPQDLLEKESFVNECRMGIEQIAEKCNSIAALVGCPNLNLEDGVLYNAAFFMHDREVRAGANKTILSDYDVFDESRYFIAGDENPAIRYKDQNIRVIFDEYENESIQKCDTLILHIGAIPFTEESYAYRKRVFSSMAKQHGIPVISVNHVGANTSLIFDGNSMVFNAKGELVERLGEFREDFVLVDTAKLEKISPVKEKIKDRIELIHNALILGICDYFRKTGFHKVILGLSGGIDSAVVAALATEALGKENVTGILMPSRFSTDHSVKDATDLADNLGIVRKTLAIEEVYDAFLHTLKPIFKDRPFDVAEENIQARIRGVLVMAISNKFGHILLNTSNKSEASVGYGTLYGDLCGSLSVLGDVYKTDVFALAHFINRDREIIPENTILKPPSAELHPGQKDQDSLPDYSTLDAILKLYIEENLSEREIIGQGFAPEVVKKILDLVNRNEYKRAQCPPILKVSKKAFGIGRRLPLNAKFNL